MSDIQNTPCSHMLMSSRRTFLILFLEMFLITGDQLFICTSFNNVGLDYHDLMKRVKFKGRVGERVDGRVNGETREGYFIFPIM